MLYYLSLGSNLGNRSYYIDEACRLLAERVGTILRRSSDFYSQPWGYVSTNEYLNICLALESASEPLEVLHLTQQIERDLGRTEKNVYHDRTIDIDLLLAFPNSSIPSSIKSSIHHSSLELTLPHPRMLERDFVLIPLREILCNG